MPERSRVAVVGGGLVGATAALGLAGQEFPVTLIEPVAICWALRLSWKLPMRQPVKRK